MSAKGQKRRFEPLSYFRSSRHHIGHRQTGPVGPLCATTDSCTAANNGSIRSPRQRGQEGSTAPLDLVFSSFSGSESAPAWLGTLSASLMASHPEVSGQQSK